MALADNSEPDLHQPNLRRQTPIYRESYQVPFVASRTCFNHQTWILISEVNSMEAGSKDIALSHSNDIANLVLDMYL